MTKLLNLIETISACRTLDDLQSLLGRLEKRRDLAPADERVLRPHLQAAANRLLIAERARKHG